MFSAECPVEMVELSGQRAVFLSRERLPLGQPGWVRMALRDEEGWLHLQPVSITLEQDRVLRDGHIAYVGMLHEDEHFAATVSTPDAPEGVRRSLRCPCHLLVRARELETEEAWAVDLSSTGLQLDCPCRLEPESHLQIHLHAPGPVLETLPLRARVAWSRNLQERWRAGLEFRDLPPYLHRELERMQGRLGL